MKADIYDHIRAQVWPSVPAFVSACIGFRLLGIFGPSVHNDVATTIELASLDQTRRRCLILRSLIPW